MWPVLSIAARGAVAFRVGGYGSATHNFHRDAMVRRGYGDAAEHIASLFASDRREEAAAAVPDAYIDDTGLFGDVARIRERFDRYLAKPYSGLTVHTDNIETLELMAELAGLSSVADDPGTSDPGTSDPAIDNGPGS